MKFRYLIIHEDYEVSGTNDEVEAKEASEWAQVVDCQEGINCVFEETAREIEQAKSYD